MASSSRTAEELLFLREKASKYALYGVLIATGAVVIATFLVGYVMLAEISVNSVMAAQTNNVALWALDSMPFIFALWGQYASSKMAREASTLVEQKTHNLREALSQANFSSKAKSDFFAKMSHELRTPINGVIGMADLLLKTRLDKDQQRYADVIKTSASGLLTLINDLLDFSKIEAGRLELEEIEFNLRECIEGSVVLLAQQAAQKGVALRTVTEPSVPRRLIGDPGRLRQIVINLVSNAIKFTESGDVLLSVKMTAASTANKAHITVEVRDSGIGMSKDVLVKLFQPYKQADSSTSRKYGGTGLGLTITKELVEAMGSTINVRSELTQGSTFWFTVELRVPPAEPGPSLAKVELKGLRVLVADANIPTRVSLVDQLKALGMDVKSVSDGIAALQMILVGANSGYKFDLVMTDMFLPYMNGEELGREVKSRPETRDIVFAIMTAAGERGDAQRLNQIGFAGYFGKPIPPEDLRDLLISIMATRNVPESHRQRLGLITKYTLAETRDQQPRLLLAEDSVINREILIHGLAGLGVIIDIVVNGREALAAVQQTPYDLVLLDLQMPEMNGMEALAAIRALRNERAQVPVIILTAGASDADKVRCQTLGANDFLIKPVDPALLEQTVSRWLAGSAVNRLSRSAPSPEQKSERDPELIRIFLEEATQRLTSLRLGLAQADTVRVAREAHSLQSASKYFHADNLHNTAAELERMAANGTLKGAEPLFHRLEDAYAMLRLTLERAPNAGRQLSD